MLIAGVFVGLGAAGVIGALFLALFVLSPERSAFGTALVVGAASAGLLTVAAGTVTVLGYLARSAVEPAWVTITVTAALLTLLFIAVRNQLALVVVALVASAGVIVPLGLRIRARLSSGHDVANASPAAILTGRPLPPPETLARLFTTANLDPIWLIACAVGLFSYLAGVWRLRRRGAPWPLVRTVSWVAGVVVLAYATSGGLALYARYLFSAQVAAHLTIAILVPLLLTLAAPIALLIGATQARTDASRGAREWTLLVARSRPAQFLARPIVSAVVFSSSLWAFYYSSALRWAVANPVARELAVAYFLAVGGLFVRAMLGGVGTIDSTSAAGASVDPSAVDAGTTAGVSPRRASWWLFLVVVLAVMVVQAAFGVAVLTSSGLFFADWFGAMGRTWGPLPLADQRTAGLIALTFGELPLAALAVALLLRQRAGAGPRLD